MTGWIRASSAMSLLGLMVVFQLGCSIDGRTLVLTVGQGGQAGTANPDAAPGPAGPSTSSDHFPVPLVPDAQGFVDGSNAVGITGVWYAYSDDSTPTTPVGECPAVGFLPEQCSQVTTPAVGAPFVPTSLPDGSMCTSGIAAQIIVNPSTMMVAWNDIWGTVIGLNFNFDPQTKVEGPYDASAHGVTGFSFRIDTPPPGSLRVEIGTEEAPWVRPSWGGTSSSNSPVTPGSNEFHWADVGGPVYVTNPPPLDPTQLIRIEFHVLSNIAAPLPYSFCISQLQALRD